MRFYKKHKWALGAVLIFALDLAIVKTGLASFVVTQISKLGSGIGGNQ